MKKATVSKKALQRVASAISNCENLLEKQLLAASDNVQATSAAIFVALSGDDGESLLIFDATMRALVNKFAVDPSELKKLSRSRITGRADSPVDFSAYFARREELAIFSECATPSVQAKSLATAI